MKRELILTKANGAQIPCIYDIPDGCGKIVIVVHGFSSSKESSNAVNLFRELGPRGFGLIAYDQPGHGHAEAAGEVLGIDACLDSLARVEAHLRKAYPAAEVCYFGSSFGAYVTGLYLALRRPVGHKAFLRCAAVNFPQLIKENPLLQAGTPERTALEETGYYDLRLGGDDPIRITTAFLKDLDRYDLFAAFDALGAGREALSLAMAHGAADDTVPVENAREFSERFGIPLTVFPGEGHTISEDPNSPPAVAALAAELYQS